MSPPFYVCTYNARSITTRQRLAAFEEEISNIKFGIVGISETRLSGSKRIDLPSGYTIYHCGRPDGERTYAGVAFYIPSAINKRVLGVVFVSDRIIELTLQLRGRRTLRLIQVHAPHAGCADADYDDFLDQLADLLQARRPTATVVLGDFNAIVGSRLPGERFVGPHSSGGRNARGETLVDFCESQKLFAMNSFFRKGRTRRWTWRSPNNQTFNEIDLFLTPSRRYISDVNVLAKFDAGSDHRLVRATFSYIARSSDLPFPRSATRQRQPELHRPTLRLEAALALRAPPHPTPAREYGRLTEALTHAASAAELVVEPPARISTATKQLFQQRRQLRFGLTNTPHATVQYAELCKSLRRALTADLHAHYLCILERAVATNRLRRARSELSSGRTQIVQLRRRDGRHTTTTADTANLVRTYYNVLYCSNDGPFNYTPSPTTHITPFTTDEVRRALYQLKSRGAAGADGVQPLAAKLAAPYLTPPLCALFNEMIAADDIPPVLASSRTILLHKAGDTTDIGNYRPISLLSVLYKTLTKIITWRIETTVAARLPPTQAGFRKGYSTLDHLHAVNMAVEKSREYNLRLSLLFVDFRKAFDTVEFRAIWDSLAYYGVDDGTTEMIKKLYAASSSIVAFASSEVPVDVQRGVRQGDTLSPLLFVLCLQYALDGVDWAQRGLQVGEHRLPYLAYADDIVLLARDVNELQSMADDLTSACATIGLTVNVTKTKWISTENQRQPLFINGEPVELVSSFIYLGQLINWPRDHGREVGRRLAAGWAAFRKNKAFFTAPRVPMRLKRRLFNQCVLPAMIYGCECWALTKAAEDRLAKAQRRMERQMVGVRLRDRWSIPRLRGATKVEDIVECARRRKWRFAAKVAALDASRWAHALTVWTPDVKRPLGRPRRRWSDDLKRLAGANWLQSAVTNIWTDMESRFVTS